MAPLTPDQSRDAFRHILRDVLGCDTTTSLYKALIDNGYDLNIASLQGISDEEIQGLSYPTSRTNDERRTILTSERSILRIWKAYLTWKHAKGEPISSEQLSTVDPSEYDTFRFGPYLQTTLRTTNNPSDGGSTKQTYTPAELFRKSVKRDTSVYPVLKNDAGWDNWHRITRAHAKTQGCSYVLDHSYIPISTDDRDLMVEVQQYMYSIFVSTLQTDIGKALVRKHEANSDAQQIYKELVAHYHASTKSSMDSGDILTYLATTTLGPGTSWRGTTHAFIIHFQEQFRIFDSLVSSPDRLTAALRRTLLQNAVAPVPALAIIKTQAAQLKTQTGQDITYEDYSDLLKSAALQHDKITTPGTGRSTRRNVYQSLTHPRAGEDFTSTGMGYNIDLPVSTILANAASTLPPDHGEDTTTLPPDHGEDTTLVMANAAARVPDHLWNKLSTNAKRT